MNTTIHEYNHTTLQGYIQIMNREKILAQVWTDVRYIATISEALRNAGRIAETRSIAELMRTIIEDYFLMLLQNGTEPITDVKKAWEIMRGVSTKGNGYNL
jgi:hypothetical protein